MELSRLSARLGLPSTRTSLCISKVIDDFHKYVTKGNVDKVKEILRSKYKDRVIDSTNSEVSFINNGFE